MRMIIDLPENGCDALVSLVNGDVIKKRTVSIENLLSNIMESYRFNTGIQPKGTRFFSGTTSKYLIGIETPAMIKKFCIVSPARRNEKSDTYVPKEVLIPLPYCLFIFEIINENLNNTWVYGLKGPIRNENDELYQFPFGNTHREGDVCWGSVAISKVQVRRPMETLILISKFFDSTYNGDLFDKCTVKVDTLKDMSNMKYTCNEDGFWILMKYLNGKQTFPLDLLYNVGKKVKDVMRRNDD